MIMRVHLNSLRNQGINKRVHVLKIKKDRFKRNKALKDRAQQKNM